MHSITTPTSSNLLPYSSTSLQNPLVKKPNNLFISTLTTKKTITKFLPNASYRTRNRNQTVLASASGPPEAEPEQEEGALGSAIEAVSEIMRECSGGSLSGEECYRMAENSPNYVKMLVGSVCELGFDQDSGDFKERVFEMGVEKGDKGIVPFLESSFGLSLPAAMHISRLCLSSNQSLPNLVVKVKF